MKKNIHPLDIVFRLAEDHAIVVLNGGGFAAPDWSLRVSFANLPDEVYDDIGRAVRASRGLFRDLQRHEGGHCAGVILRKAEMTIESPRICAKQAIGVFDSGSGGMMGCAT